MKSGMISMVLFQMRFAFRWDITSLAYRIPYSLIVYLFWVHLIIFIPSMIELYCFSLDQGPCFAGFLEYSLTNALLVTFRHFRILNIALAKPVTTPPARIFKGFPTSNNKKNGAQIQNAGTSCSVKRETCFFEIFFTFWWGSLQVQKQTNTYALIWQFYPTECTVTYWLESGLVICQKPKS